MRKNSLLRQEAWQKPAHPPQTSRADALFSTRRYLWAKSAKSTTWNEFFLTPHRRSGEQNALRQTPTGIGALLGMPIRRKPAPSNPRSGPCAPTSQPHICFCRRECLNRRVLGAYKQKEFWGREDNRLQICSDQNARRGRKIPAMPDPPCAGGGSLSRAGRRFNGLGTVRMKPRGRHGTARVLQRLGSNLIPPCPTYLRKGRPRFGRKPCVSDSDNGKKA